MKNKAISKLLKGVSIALVAVMAIGAGIVSYSNEAQAATSDANVPTEIAYEKVSNAATYAKDNKAPKVSEVSQLKEGYLFAGWYQDDKTTPYTNKDEVPDNAYAKFVPAYILGVKSQVAYKDTKDSKDYKTQVRSDSPFVTLRLVSAVDSKQYQEVGFTITAKKPNSDTESTWNTHTDYKKKVYSKLKQNGQDVSASDMFGKNASYFFTYEVRNIPSGENFETAFYATPYWVTLDGTRVEGLSKYSHVEDYYEGLLSVPVYVKSSEKAAAGIVSVEFEKEKVTFDSYESGKLFEEGLAVDHKDGTVKCVANVKDITSEKSADGLFINLRFKMTGFDIEEFEKGEFEGTGYTFNVNAPSDQFCNVDEELLSTLTDGKNIIAYDIKY